MIGRKFQTVRRARELLFPISQILLEITPIEIFALPDSVVGILKTRCQQWGWLIVPERFIERSQFSRENGA